MVNFDPFHHLITKRFMYQLTMMNVQTGIESHYNWCVKTNILLAEAMIEKVQNNNS